MGDRASNSRPFQRRAAQRSIISEARKAIGQCRAAGLGCKITNELDVIQVFVLHGRGFREVGPRHHPPGSGVLSFSCQEGSRRQYVDANAVLMG